MAVGCCSSQKLSLSHLADLTHVSVTLQILTCYRYSTTVPPRELIHDITSTLASAPVLGDGWPVDRTAQRCCAASGMAEGNATTISVRFVSRLPEPVELPESAFAVPETLTRKGLAEVINGLLQLDPPQPFDFLINEDFLRSSLATFLKNRRVRALAAALTHAHHCGSGCSINNIRSATMSLAIASTWR